MSKSRDLRRIRSRAEPQDQTEEPTREGVRASAAPSQIERVIAEGAAPGAGASDSRHRGGVAIDQGLDLFASARAADVESRFEDIAELCPKVGDGVIRRL